MSSENEEWIQQYDETTGDYYYFNSITGQTSWNLPEEADVVTLVGMETQPQSQSIGNNFPAGQIAPSNSGPDSSWQIMKDEETDLYYYYNERTGESRWDKPDDETSESPSFIQQAADVIWVKRHCFLNLS